jgi:hypothetical protein
MEVWAKARPEVQFICVCVDSKGVALQFTSMFGFEHALNCWIPARQYFPAGYGQLGCSGFIVVDTKGCFVSRKTKAYLQYGDAAFSHVQELLSQEVVSLNKDSIPHGSKNSVLPKEFEEEKKSDVIPLVGVISMDQEHEDCDFAISSLLETNSLEALQNVIVTFTDHFNHEERLMKKYGFGNAGNGSTFSAFASHTKDHERILSIGQCEIDRLSTTSNFQACGPSS